MDQEHPGRGTVGRQLAAGEVDRVRREVARHAEFAAVSEQIAEVNEKICEARAAAGTDAPSVPEGEKGGSEAAIAQEKAAEIGRLAAEAARSLGCGGAGMEAAEAVIRAGMLQLGGGMLEKLLAADPGCRGPRVPCGRGHEAAFVSCRDKVMDTVLGPVTLTRAWYHCAACGHGLAPRDGELGVAGASMSPGLRAMNDHAAAAGPFAKAARLLEHLAGVRLTVKRVERAAEASGTAAAAAVRGRAALITARKLVPFPPSPLPDKHYAAIDGTGVPVIREGYRRAGRQRRGRPRPDPRGQARRVLHPGQAGQRRLPRP